MAPKAAAAPAKKAGAKKYVHKQTKAAGFKKVKRSADNFTTLRKSLTPGTVVILLAGRFRGKRAVMVKQLPKNGPIVVSGPFKFNGVPLRRVDSRYVIATSTKVDLAGLDTSKITPTVFQRPKTEKRVKSEKDFLGDKAKKAAQTSARKAGKKTVSTGPNAGKVSAERLALQKAIDSGIVAALKKDTLGKAKAGYLRSIFTIKAGDQPHRMAF
jgi:large subunit ribosomal protein L6e